MARDAWHTFTPIENVPDEIHTSGSGTFGELPGIGGPGSYQGIEL